jgi:hypothetical protein
MRTYSNLDPRGLCIHIIQRVGGVNFEFIKTYDGCRCLNFSFIFFSAEKLKITKINLLKYIKTSLCHFLNVQPGLGTKSIAIKTKMQVSPDRYFKT